MTPRVLGRVRNIHKEAWLSATTDQRGAASTELLHYLALHQCDHRFFCTVEKARIFHATMDGSKLKNAVLPRSRNCPATSLDSTRCAAIDQPVIDNTTQFETGAACTVPAAAATMSPTGSAAEPATASRYWSALRFTSFDVLAASAPSSTVVSRQVPWSFGGSATWTAHALWMSRVRVPRTPQRVPPSEWKSTTSSRHVVTPSWFC